MRNHLRRFHRRCIYPLLDFALPTACFSCAAPLGAWQRLGACASCWSSLRPLATDCCTGCGLPAPGATDLLGPIGRRCAGCLLRPPIIRRVQALVAYDATARAFLLRAKLGSRPELLHALGLQLARAVERSGIGRDCTAIVPVPSHPWSTLQRGFRPAVELARPVARGLGIGLRPSWIHRSWSSPLTARNLRAGARRRSAAEAFRVRRTVAGERVLLVDDVITTGASVSACAHALIGRGAQEVRSAAWARTLPGAV